MKTVITILFSITAFFASAQQNEELPEGKYANFTLDQVSLVQVDGINFFDIGGTKSKYYVNLSFGKNTFDLELREISNNKLAWAFFGTGRHLDLKVNQSKSNSVIAVFTLDQKEGDIKTSYEVSIMKASRSITASYNESKASDGKIIRSVIASGHY